MGVYKLSANSVKNGRTIYGSMLAGNTAYTIPTSFESISTATVGSGGASSVDFTSIPSTYSHLQIRAITKGSTTSRLYMRFNNVSTGTPYDYHALSGNGTSAGAIADISENEIWLAVDGQSATTDTFTGLVVDILDYSNTNKNKTTRSLGGHSIDSASYWIVWYESGLWRNTAAINRITLTPGAGTISQYSHFALYGIRSA